MAASISTHGPAPGSTLPGSWYADPEHHRRELDSVFRHDWVAVGLDVDVAEPGSFLAASAGAAPVVVVRDEAGTLRAFLNVCRHRGAPIAEGCGRARALRCPYHSWVFRLDGSLAKHTGTVVPGDFGPGDFGLFEIRVATFARSILVNLDPDAPAFDPGPLAAGIAPYGLDELEFDRRDRYTRAFNWKVLLENYSENYHTPTVHPQLPVAGYEYPMLCDGPIVFAWDRPLQPRDPSERALLHHTPLDAGWAAVGEHMAAESFYNGAYITCFPNMMISMFAKFAATFRLIPTGPNTTTIERDYLWHPSVPRERRDRDYEATRLVVDQDLVICEATQRTYDAGLSAHGVLSTEHEAGIAHVHRLLGGALAPTP